MRFGTLQRPSGPALIRLLCSRRSFGSRDRWRRFGTSNGLRRMRISIGNRHLGKRYSWRYRSPVAASRLARLMALVAEVRLALGVGLQERGLKKEAADELELVRRTALSDSPQTTSAAQVLANLVSSSEPRRAAECFEQRRLHTLNVRGDFPDVEAYLGVSHFIHRMNAKAALLTGDPSKVKAELDACDAVLPAD